MIHLLVSFATLILFVVFVLRLNVEILRQMEQARVRANCRTACRLLGEIRATTPFQRAGVQR